MTTEEIKKAVEEIEMEGYTFPFKKEQARAIDIDIVDASGRLVGSILAGSDEIGPAEQAIADLMLKGLNGK